MNIVIQMPTVAKIKVRILEFILVSHVVVGAQRHESSILPAGSALTGGWSWEPAGDIEPRNSNVDRSILTGILTAWLSAHPHHSICSIGPWMFIEEYLFVDFFSDNVNFPHQFDGKMHFFLNLEGFTGDSIYTTATLNRKPSSLYGC